MRLRSSNLLGSFANAGINLSESVEGLARVVSKRVVDDNKLAWSPSVSNLILLHVRMECHDHIIGKW